MRYVIKVTDPRHPGRTGWIGDIKEAPIEGPLPIGMKGMSSKYLADAKRVMLRMQFKKARLLIVGFEGECVNGDTIQV